MVRCDALYDKIQKLRELGAEAVNSFCNKDPNTVGRIEAYLDKILPLVEELTTKSEILLDKNMPIVNIVSETASRSLVSEKDPEVRKEAMRRIVKLAEEKVMDGHKWNMSGSGRPIQCHRT